MAAKTGSSARRRLTPRVPGRAQESMLWPASVLPLVWAQPPVLTLQPVPVSEPGLVLPPLPLAPAPAWVSEWASASESVLTSAPAPALVLALALESVLASLWEWALVSVPAPLQPRASVPVLPWEMTPASAHAWGPHLQSGRHALESPRLASAPPAAM